jgi:hypothetical protein
LHGSLDIETLCAQDYAAQAQDEEIIQILIDAGAVIVRENRTFVGPRQATLDHVTDPDTYRTVLLQHEKEMAVRDKAEADLLAMKVANAEKARIRKLHRDLIRKRDNRLESLKQRDLAMRNKEVRDQRMAKLASEDMADRSKHAEKMLQFGEWRKAEDGSNLWQWEHRKTYENKTFHHIYDQARDQMQELRDYNCFEKFDGRWNAVTGKHLEVPWGRGEAFIVEGIDNNKTVDEIRIQHSRPHSVAGEDKSSIMYKDENDKELEGEDLDDILGSLTKR